MPRRKSADDKLTSYVNDSEDEDEGEGIALEDDVAAPKHEARVERPRLDLDDSDAEEKDDSGSDSDSVGDLESLMYGTGKKPSGNKPSGNTHHEVYSPWPQEPTWDRNSMRELLRENDRETRKADRLQAAEDYLANDSSGLPSAGPTDIPTELSNLLAKNISYDGDAEKMQQAIDRTDLLFSDVNWNFFAGTPCFLEVSSLPANLPPSLEFFRGTCHLYAKFYFSKPF